MWHSWQSPDLFDRFLAQLAPAVVTRLLVCLLHRGRSASADAGVKSVVVVDE